MFDVFLKIFTEHCKKNDFTPLYVSHVCSDAKTSKIRKQATLSFIVILIKAEYFKFFSSCNLQIGMIS